MDTHADDIRMEVNNDWAQRVRRRLSAAHVACVNLLSGPGSGKTTLIEAALRSLQGIPRIAVIEGERHTALDVARIVTCGARVIRVDAEPERHLEAKQVDHALEHFDLSSVDLLMVENAGNLAYSAPVDLGESYRVTVLSVSQGHEQTEKYPELFRNTDLVILNKIDLLPHVDFDLVHFNETLNRLYPNVPTIQVSCRAGTGIREWCGWLRTISGTAI